MSSQINNGPDNTRIKTPIGEAWVEGGLLWHRIDQTTEVTERSALATVEVLRDLVGSEPVPAVVDIRGVQFADRAARDVFANKMTHERATALIVGSRMSQALGNAYLRASRPERPTRMFTSPRSARAWALTVAS